MLNLPISPKQLFTPVVISLLAIILWIFEPNSSELFAYERQKIEQNEWWRIISAHLLHTNFNHMLLNLGGLWLLWALHGQYYTNKTLMSVLFIGLGTSIGLYYFATGLTWYVGLSGTLHGLFIMGAYFDVKHKMLSGWLLLFGVIAKVIHEQIFGASQDIATLINANVAIDAHLYGLLMGLVVIGYFQLKQTFAKKS